MSDIPESIGGADRMKYRNASSSPMVMRVSPFGGWEDLRKTYRGEGFKGNFATAHGHKYEDAARQKAKDKLCLDLSGPHRFIAGEYAASLDDITVSGETIVELKCPAQGKKSKIWKSVNDFGEPSYYYAQMQHQLLCVPSAQRVILFVYDAESEDYVWTEVDRSQPYMSELQSEWDKFMLWKDTDDSDPGDGWVRRIDGTWDNAATAYLRSKEKFDKAKEEMDAYRQDLIDMADGDKVQGSGVQVIHTFRQGSVDYKKVPELQGVDLDKYRAEQSEVWTVTSKGKK